MTLRRQQRALVRGGFTLMEMLVVVAILVMLAGAAVPIYMKYLDEARKDRAKVDVKTISQVVETYMLKYGEPPASLQVLCQPTPDGGRPYLEIDALKDPWGREYQYAPNGPHNAHLGKPDVWSLGPRLNDPNGMIGNWSGGQGL
jgi:general secretion pathway protein G